MAKKMSRRLVTKEEKEKIIEILKGADPIEKEKIKKSLPSVCFRSGNTSAINWKQLDKYLVTNEDTLFSKQLGAAWKGMLSQVHDPAERYVLMEYLAASQYGCTLTEGLYNNIAYHAGLKVKKHRVTTDMVRKISDKFGIPEAKIHAAINTRGRYMAETLMANAVKNINAKIASSKSKKVAAKQVSLLANPTVSEFRAYGKSRLRPDIVVRYMDDGEMAYLCHEHFGWRGSTDYVEKMTRKLSYCVDNGIPFFYSAPAQNDVFIQECDEEARGSLEAGVYNWCKANYFVSETSADALYIAIERMLSYVNMERFNLPIEELFKA